MIFSLPNIAIVVVLCLFGIGLYGVLISRNLIKVVIGLQLAVKGAMLALVLAGRLSSQVDVGQSMALTVIVADTITAVVALALAVRVRSKFGTLDIQALTNLKR
jgi:NADH-quinone oxidoreductase subunit K